TEGSATARLLDAWPGGSSEPLGCRLRAADRDRQYAYVIEGPDGPLYADFHSLRHSYIALLEQSGATLKQAMQLARHSDPKLPMARHGRTQLHDLAETVSRPPSLLPTVANAEAAALAATGTDPRPSDESLRPACASSEAGCDSVRALDTPDVLKLG